MEEQRKAQPVFIGTGDRRKRNQKQPPDILRKRPEICTKAATDRGRNPEGAGSSRVKE